MADVLGVVFELVIAALGWAIYGTPERPRPMILRATLRFFVFGGWLAALLMVLSVLPSDLLPFWLIFPWAVCLLIVICAEHELGKTWIAFAALGCGATLLGAGLVT